MADDDEDRWLYGDSSDTADSKEKDKETSLKSDSDSKTEEETKDDKASTTETSPTKEKAPVDVAAPGTDDASLDATGEEEDSDDDSEDDDVQITIGDIKSGPPSFPHYGLKPSAYRKTNVAPSSSSTTVTLPAKPEKTLDLEAEGTINGTGVYSYEVEAMPEKPWNKPGADITDYFNYGLNEDTWKIYSDKQKKLRMEHKITVHHAGAKDSTVPPGEEKVKLMSKPSWSERHKKPFVRHPVNQSVGAISVISTISRRRDSDSTNNFDVNTAVSSSSISTVQSGPRLISMQQPPIAPATIPTMHSAPPPRGIPVMQMSHPPPNMAQPPPFGAPPIQQLPAFHNGPPMGQRRFMAPMNRPPPPMNRPPIAYNNSMPPPHMGGMPMGLPPTGAPPPTGIPHTISSAPPPRMPVPPPQVDTWNRAPYYPNANAPHFTPRTPSTPIQALGPRPTPSPSPGPPGGSNWDRQVSGFPSFQDQWSPRAGSEESDISSGSDGGRKSSPTKGAEGEDRRESRDRDRSREKERRGRYAKENSRERDRKHSEKSHDKDKDRDRKRDKEDKHRKRKDRDEERASDGHRSSRHKRSKHSHRDTEREERSSSRGQEELGKDLVIADSI